MQSLEISNPHKYAKDKKIDSVMLRKIVEYCGFEPVLVSGTTKLYSTDVFERVIRALDELKNSK